MPPDPIKRAFLPRLALKALLFAPVALTAPPDCTPLEQLQLPDVRIAETLAHEAEGAGSSNLAHCQTEGIVGDEIGFLIVLPEKARWNGKFFMAGIGGFDGRLDSRDLRSAPSKGYAAATTDTGHRSSTIRADWAHNNLERQVNYGYLAVHPTAVTAKAIIRGFYGASPQHSHFSGCSSGGRQALMEAQRYPGDFDGLIAGAPDIDFTGGMAAAIYNVQRVFPNPDDVRNPVITPENRRLLQSRILEHCDAVDGLEDGILDDPRACKFKLSSLPLCPGDEPAPHCLTIAQREAIAAVYDGPRNQDGPIYPGFPFGAEDEPGGWDSWITGPHPEWFETEDEPTALFVGGTEFFKYFGGCASRRQQASHPRRQGQSRPSRIASTRASIRT